MDAVPPIFRLTHTSSLTLGQGQGQRECEEMGRPWALEAEAHARVSVVLLTFLFSNVGQVSVSTSVM